MPYDRYRKDLQQEGFRHDPAQERAIQHLQRVYDELVADPAPAATKKSGLLALLTGRNHASTRTTVKGLYLWGGVGRGKTYLVDTFFDALPFEAKRRTHFHRFMHEVHAELRQLKHQQQPLKSVARYMANQTRILCLDEFFVSDITDAMLLSGLLHELFARGVTLVTTSNIPPDDLYQNGLQRSRFLPAIALIKEHVTVINVDGGIDYRLRFLERAEIYHHPSDQEAEGKLADTFRHLVPEPGTSSATLMVKDRSIETRRLADGVVWFDFTDICDGPRGQADYIELARCFHTVLISNIPVMDWQMENQARRFLTLVDEFYDRNVKLIVAAAAAPDALYVGKKLEFEFLRTASRLHEMQSLEYLARQHLP